MRSLAVLRAVLFVPCWCSLVWGQSSTSSLRGIVSDPQGAVVVGAKVNLANPNTGFSQSTTTDNLGAYQFLQTPPGTYYADRKHGRIRHPQARKPGVASKCSARRSTSPCK